MFVGVFECLCVSVFWRLECIYDDVSDARVVGRSWQQDMYSFMNIMSSPSSCSVLGLCRTCRRRLCCRHHLLRTDIVCVCAFKQLHLRMVLLLERLCLTTHGVTMDGSLRVPEHHTSSDLQIQWPAHARRRAAHPRRRPHQVRSPGVCPESRQRSFLPDSETAGPSSGQPASLTCKRARSSSASSCQNIP